jgi:predicted nuclease with RNAse H fold
MSQDEKVWAGADPGGENNFGVALLRNDGSTCTRCVSCADEAVDLVCEWLGESSPAGVGVDAPLWWSSGRSSARLADQWLRDAFGLQGWQVQQPNALQGAALIQAAMFVLRIRERFQNVCVTETHPKALLAVWERETGNDFLDDHRVEWVQANRQEHERDALISAVAAREAFEGRWTHDLSECRYPSEQDPSESWLGPVRYFWPHKQ